MTEDKDVFTVAVATVIFVAVAICFLLIIFPPMNSDPTTPNIGDTVNCNKYTTIIIKNKLYNEGSKEFGYELISQSNNHLVLDYHKLYLFNDNDKNKEVWETLPLQQTIRINPIFCIDNKCLINQALPQNITSTPEICSNCCKVIP